MFLNLFSIKCAKFIIDLCPAVHFIIFILVISTVIIIQAITCCLIGVDKFLQSTPRYSRNPRIAGIAGVPLRPFLLRFLLRFQARLASDLDRQ